jgi:hypothetical protein
MFLKLQLDHPNVLLLPSADILFVMLSHVFRTKKYHEDRKRLALPVPDPLCLTEEEERFYNEAVAATGWLWKIRKEFYFCRQFFSEVATNKQGKVR